MGKMVDQVSEEGELCFTSLIDIVLCLGKQHLGALSDHLDPVVTERFFRTPIERFYEPLGSNRDNDVGRVLDHSSEVFHGAPQLVAVGLNPGDHGVERFLQHSDLILAVLVEAKI